MSTDWSECDSRKWTGNSFFFSSKFEWMSGGHELYCHIESRKYHEYQCRKSDHSDRIDQWNFLHVHGNCYELKRYIISINPFKLCDTDIMSHSRKWRLWDSKRKYASQHTIDQSLYYWNARKCHRWMSMRAV